MGKINFTKEHLAQLKTAIGDAILNNITVKGLTSDATVYNLINNYSINSLRDLAVKLSEKVKKLSISDEWEEDVNQEKIDALNVRLNLVNLIRGYKLKQQELLQVKIDYEAAKKAYTESVNMQKTPQEILEENKAKMEACRTILDELS